MLELRNALLPNGQCASVTIHDGQITQVGDPTDSEKVIDCQGLLLLPGLIDEHVHFRYPGEPAKEDWMSGVQAAIRGGVTYVADVGNHPAPYSVTTLEALERKAALVGERDIGYGFWFMATGNNWLIMCQAAKHRLVVGLKLFMEVSTGGLVVSNTNLQLAHLQQAADCGLLVAIHAGDEALNIRNRKSYVDPPVSAHCKIRSPLGEISGIANILHLIERAGCRAHFFHVSTREGLALIGDAKKKGLPVTCEVCPHHWVFTSDDMSGERAAWLKMNPPLRALSTVKAVRAAVINGLVDTIGSDHAPHAMWEKMRARYDDIPSGIPGVQERLSICWELVHQGRMSFDRFVELNCRSPARLLGLARKGEISEGYDADLVLIDPDEEVSFNNSAISSKCGWTAYGDLMFHGAVKMTVASGQVLLNNLQSALK